VKAALALALLAAGATPASAHGGAADYLGSAETWTTAPSITVPLFLAGLLYWIGTLRVWRRAGHGRGVRRWEVACFWAGWLALAAALLSPLHWLGERLFTAHMIEHEIMMTVAAPLIVLARPGGAYLWALPASWRPALGGIGQVRALAAVWRWLTDPLGATVLHGFAIWVWHAPALFEAAVRIEAVHWLQHASFLVSALLFWWALVHGRARERGYGAAVFYLFATALHTGFLGILLTVARKPWYPVQTAFAAEWGLTPLEDQQLGGLIMWVPGGMGYLVAALALAALWIRRSGALGGKGGGHALRAP
jgi:cytochrome c oxidase assembly factor CtaG